MFNRRLLRIKTLQTYYSFAVCQEANYNLGLQHLSEIFSPDLNSMEFQDKDLLNSQKQITQDAFTAWYQSYDRQVTALSEKKLNDALVTVTLEYNNRVKADLQKFSKLLVEQTEGTYYWYLFVLMLGAEVAGYVNVVESEKDGKMIKQAASLPHELKLANNPVFKYLTDNEQFNKQVLAYKVGFKADEQDLVKAIYKNSLKNDETYKEYVAKKEISAEEEHTFAKYFFNNILLKSDDLKDYFEKEDIRWEEDKSIIKDMLSKTLKHIASGEKEILSPLSANWDEDKEFMLTLLKETISHELEFASELAPKMKNWDMERVALSDRLIMNMALAEMISFPSIPVKVSINEYIELSKNYSTPKSKDFINGILDSVSQSMIKSGKIKKSGRGLLDNK